ncbi:hypothetical protein CROQUDRAFT_665184 [Cronartium quercuum f. sp. fusiforme G11]|uniref:Amino acid transporter n=1 Tax=Cronartium quercuum f. sp. fusiforme G11 TaxID=708437 RepID=A0A9P6T7G5_9BASI|nr:hypothetical protein CROQUDRAFT_665184 [Cronartium quercuum f. sp. fusiforme G11]
MEANEETATIINDEAILAGIGYKQELQRSWGLLQSFGVSFSIISVISGITTLFGTGLNVGGPAVMVWGWIVVSVMTTLVALGMAEIVSAIPTSGGPYFWSAVLTPRRYSGFAAWLTGWFNIGGQIAVTTGIDYSCANLISSTAAAVHSSYVSTPRNIIGIYTGLLISHGLCNTFGVRILGILNYFSVILHSLGVGALAIAVVAKARTHQSANFVFERFNDGTGGWSERASPAYVAVCGILFTQYTITGFDASAHMAEETSNASVSVPLGVLTSVIASSIFGFGVLLAFLFSIQDFQSTLTSPQPVLQIMIDVFGLKGAQVAITLIVLCVWHCGLFSLTSNSRMLYAFARDRGLPSRTFGVVHEKLKCPVQTVWLSVVLAFLLGLSSFGSQVALAAATSIATIGLYISYGLPIFFSVLNEKNFTKGPFYLGRFSLPVRIVACVWVGFITIVFCLPTQNPVTSKTLNFTPVVVGIIAIWAVVSWYLWAHRFFSGPVAFIDDPEPKQINETNDNDVTEI